MASENLDRQTTAPSGGKEKITAVDDFKIYREYVTHLGLQPEDIKGTVLDIGAGSAQFARWAEQHGISKKVVSFDVQADDFEHNKNLVVGSADALPFGDETFDIVVSNSAVPNNYAMELHAEHPEQMHDKLEKVVGEMMRVVRPGGQIRFGPIKEGSAARVYKDFRGILDDVLEQLKNSSRVGVTVTPLGEADYGNGVKDNESYVVITKPEK